jgi:hypothetical protein
MLAYLCGPLDSAEDGGRLWRRKLTPFLRDQLGHRVYDPSEGSPKALTDEENANLADWQKADVDRFRRAVRKIIAFNLDLLEHKADYLICYWSAEEAQGSGAPAEMTVAYRKGIPVYLITPLPVQGINIWVLGCSDQVFASIEVLKEFLSSRFSRERQTQLWKE